MTRRQRNKIVFEINEVHSSGQHRYNTHKYFYTGSPQMMKTTSSYLAITKFSLTLQSYKYSFTPATSGLNKYSFIPASSGLTKYSFLLKPLQALTYTRSKELQIVNFGHKINLFAERNSFSSYKDRLRKIQSIGSVQYDCSLKRLTLKCSLRLL